MAIHIVLVSTWNSLYKLINKILGHPSSTSSLVVFSSRGILRHHAFGTDQTFSIGTKSGEPAQLK